MDRGGVTEATAGQLFGAGMDQLVQSAPLLLDLAGGAAIAKGLLKRTTKGMAKRATAKAGKKSLRKEGEILARNPENMRMMSNKAAKAMDDRVDYILSESAKAQRRINQTGAFFVSDALVASQMHSDNVGQDWYDNLSGTERFTYLGIQAGAEVASGMVLGNIFARGFGPGKMTRNILTAERSAIKEYGKNIVRSTLLGATEEVFAEGATAAIQYRNEISARIKGGDESAYFDDGEFRRKVLEGATAGLLMGGLAGGLSGTVVGAAKATLATMHKTSIDAKKEQAKAAEFLSTAFSLAMSVMLIMLVMQFNSFYQAALILFSVVMSTAGVLLGLLIAQATFSTVLTGVGIVALAGIVVNNNIVLIDTYNYLRRHNRLLTASEAVYSAAKSRFRPVMLTTITTIVGLLPLANGLSIDLVNRSFTIGGMVASWWQPLASAIVNGLVVSTILTLLLTPAMLLLPEIISKRLGMRVADHQFEDDVV